VRPYYDDPDANSLLAGHLPLKGLIVGLNGAAAYEQATSAPGAATALWPAMGGGLLGAALIILLGNLFFGVLGALRRRRA
jgi:predicted lipid-binding transport protein (Tim44 family)